MTKRPTTTGYVWDKEGEPRIETECESRLREARAAVDLMGQMIATMVGNLEHPEDVVSNECLHELVIRQGRAAMADGSRIFPSGWESPWDADEDAWR